MEEYTVKYENNIIYGPDFEEEVPKGGLGIFIHAKCREYSDRITQICPYENRSLTYGELGEKGLHLAKNLKENFGLKQGDVIICCMRNSVKNAIPVVASFFLNCLIANLDPTLSARDCEHLIKLSKPKVVFVDAESVPMIEAAIKDITFEIRIIVNGSKDVPNTLSKTSCNMADLIEGSSKDFQFEPVYVEDQNAPIAILFSSGTTGLPKGICLSHKSLYYCSLNFWEGMGKPDCSMHYTTLYWISGFCFFIMQFFNGSKRIGLRQCNPEFDSEVIFKHRVESAFMSTSLTYKLFEIKQFEKKYDMSSLKQILMGGMPITESYSKRLQAAFPDINFNNAYGMTEIGMSSSFYGPFKSKFFEKSASCGQICRGTILKVIDENGNTLGPNKSGQICIKSQQLMVGYYNNTDDVPVDKEGFVQSGDIGHYDEEFFLYIYDRIKDMFKYQSWHIVPASIEAIINEHPAVQESVVFGIPHEEDGFVPSAAIKLKSSDVGVTEEDIVQFLDDKLVDRQRLRGGIYFIPEIPRTPTGKLRRKIVQEYVMQNILSK